jgi:hypothetical protein
MGAQVLVAEGDARRAKVLRLYPGSEGCGAVVLHDGRAAPDGSSGQFTVLATEPGRVVIRQQLPGRTRGRDARSVMSPRKEPNPGRRVRVAGPEPAGDPRAPA